MSLHHYNDVNSRASIARYPLAEQYIAQPGVHVTSSGLMYRIIELGSGDSPSWDATVKVQQRVMTATGYVLYDTRQIEQLAEYEIAEAIEGLQEALMLMTKGSRYELLILPHLAYDIYSTVLNESLATDSEQLIFMDITLIDFN
ncbi:FKBP-type peptidyl-prolyl cis-trans isomerase [Pseudoalteromonas haloplanktis]|uniref:Peptidyl-prolyl cis-trans isomerase n=1 Tax=Pseudoalteromonas haloplanktis TaxID=228 RepID=A0ABU1BB63_PSEHA|nr:FKBP-type peptidyl-prolyl cis-trans isomerase [Pseudoalteromonas haloplanktis]MDQ9091630.1 FKBP-type peptidyl-prolyl cis-trans isomerase [Pseudoalteromonas haloplanktis]